MGSLMKSSLSGSIHRIREFELEKVNLAEEFDILQIVGEGWFGKILLVEHKATDSEMVLKALPKPYTALKDFYREFHYGLHLGVHKNIITAYDVAFETAGFYVFSQEYAPLGDLTSNVSDTGIGELHTKRVAKQLSAALEHLHTRDLVHRDIKLDNILVFKSDFSRIKLCDFGETRRTGSVVLRRNEWLPYAPPEVLQIPTDGSYMANTSHDVWQFAIVLFVCLTGCLPWQKAAMDDPRYTRYQSWQSSSMPIKRQPKLFRLITSKAQRLFKKYLEPKPEKRPAGLAEIHRFLEDRWLSKGGIEKTNETAAEEEGLCPSMYSFHSSPEEKNKLLRTLTEYGLETTVDRKSKKDRIRQWIQTTVIEEETEEDLQEDDEYFNEEDIKIRDNQTGPIGERVLSRGPVSEVKVTNGYVKTENSIRKERRVSNGNVRKMSDVYIPPIDPRIPLEQQRNKTIPRKRVQFDESVENKSNEKHEQNGISNGHIGRDKDINDNKYNGRRHSNGETSKGDEMNDRRPSLPFSVAGALPFQNLQIVNNSLTSLESAQSNDSFATVRHKINIQMPQSDAYHSLYSKQNGSIASNRGSLPNGMVNGIVNGKHITNGVQSSPRNSPVKSRPSLSKSSSRSPSK